MSGKQRILELLRDGKPHTHHELYGLGCIAHSRISDLRRDGYTIEQWNEGNLYLYRLALEDSGSISPEPAAAEPLSSSAPDMAAAAEDGALELHPAQLSLGVAA